jgi:hypothetical protein
LFVIFIKLRLFQTSVLEQQPLKNAVLQGFSLKNCKSLVQNRAPGYAGNVSVQSISFGTGSIDKITGYAGNINAQSISFGTGSRNI